jgi:hypothetical protein
VISELGSKAVRFRTRELPVCAQSKDASRGIGSTCIISASGSERREASGAGPRKAAQRGGNAGLQVTGSAHGSTDYTVKLGPIGARRVSEGRRLVRQKSRNAFIFRRFRLFQQAEEAPRHQVVWS